MTDKELRKLKRAELLEIMVAQSKEIDRLNKELADANARLASRELDFEQVGSIAQASLQIFDLFQNAQKAADLYLENVKRITAQSIGEAALRELDEESAFEDPDEESYFEESDEESSFEDLDEENSFEEQDDMRSVEETGDDGELPASNQEMPETEGGVS